MKEQKNKRAWEIRFLLAALLFLAGGAFVNCDRTEEQVIAYLQCVARAEEKYRMAPMEAESSCQSNEVWDDMFDNYSHTPLGEINTNHRPTPYRGTPPRVRDSGRAK
jgi:hypothetical protein